MIQFKLDERVSRQARNSIESVEKIYPIDLINKCGVISSLGKRVRGLVTFQFKSCIVLLQYYCSGYYPTKLGNMDVGLLRY